MDLIDEFKKAAGDMTRAAGRRESEWKGFSPNIKPLSRPLPMGHPSGYVPPYDARPAAAEVVKRESEREVSSDIMPLSRPLPMGHPSGYVPPDDAPPAEPPAAAEAAKEETDIVVMMPAKIRKRVKGLSGQGGGEGGPV